MASAWLHLPSQQRVPERLRLGGGDHRWNPNRLLRRSRGQGRLGRFRQLLFFFRKQRGGDAQGLNFLFQPGQFKFLLA